MMPEPLECMEGMQNYRPNKKHVFWSLLCHLLPASPMDFLRPEFSLKDGGLEVFFKDEILHLRAGRYDSGGADADLMIRRIQKVTSGVTIRSFKAVVCLNSIWCSKGTQDSTRDSSERCIRVLAALFDFGCLGLQGDLDLGGNDLDDQFFEDFFALLGNRFCNLKEVLLDKNRITTQGALGILGYFHNLPQGQGPSAIRLHRNPIADRTRIQEIADVTLELGMPWSLENGKKALERQKLWEEYFTGPAQLLRAEVLKRLDPAEPMPLVECPICGCILKHSPKRTHTTMPNTLQSHLTGTRHRKNLEKLFSSMVELPLILIVCPDWGLTLHPLTGELQCVESGGPRAQAEPPSTSQVYLDIRPEAPDPRHIQAIVSSETRASLVSLGEPVFAYEFLDELSKTEEEGTSAGNQTFEKKQQSNEVSLWPSEPLRIELKVDEIEYTQSWISSQFKDGKQFEDLLNDLDNGKVDPCVHPNMCLEVVEQEGIYYSIDNRRLYCLKEYQKKWKHCGWRVRVAVRLHRAPSGRVRDRFLERISQRRREGSKFGEIRMRRHSQHRSSWRVSETWTWYLHSRWNGWWLWRGDLESRGFCFGCISGY